MSNPHQQPEDEEAAPDPNRYPSPWATGWKGRCPRCGEGRLYSGFLKVAPRCGVCGLDLSGEDAGDGAVPFLILLIGALGVGFGMVFLLGYDWSVWGTLAVTAPLIVVLTILSIPKAKGLLIALQFVNRAGDTGRSSFDQD
ncbi:MAG: DUF983 domain-containing protein [Marivibrio sp.]|uniref:DUF983 domain-containing protein n=1 Tax=Marivibrio sp. TaxID=2039719 RepID=UPI0032ECAA3E